MARSGAVDLAFQSIGGALLAHIFAAAHIAEAFLDAAFHFVRGPLHLARRFRRIVLRTPLGLHLVVTSDLANAFFDVALELVHTFAHGCCTPPRVSYGCRKQDPDPGPLSAP